MNEITDKEFIAIRDFLKKKFGISLNEEKKGLVYSRLRTHLLEKGFKNFTEYYDYLVNEKTGDAVQYFVNALSTNHTYFMRESDHFDYFKNYTLPFIEGSSKEKDLRLWCAACSSGEEPYTLQMIVQDYFKSKPGWNLQILATDISEKVLDKAVYGVYSNESLSVVPDSWKREYFVKHNESSMMVSPEIKKQIAFRKFNLMNDVFPFKKPFHVIFCRNVMIYFDAQTRDSLVNKFYEATLKDGFLFIGHAESLNHTGTKYKYVMPAIYRKST